MTAPPAESARPLRAHDEQLGDRDTSERGTPGGDVTRALVAGALGERFAGKTLVVPTGNFKVRANDTDYRFRAGTDFFYLTGCDEPDAVLVISPGADGPRSTLYVAAPARRTRRTSSSPTRATASCGSGARRGVDEAAVYYAIDTAPLEDLEKDLVALGGTDVVTLRGFDAASTPSSSRTTTTRSSRSALSEMRLVKDDFEIAQLQGAVDFTVKGFEDVVRALPAADGRGERVIEGVFNLRARVEGNDVGYDTIAASGPARHDPALDAQRRRRATRRPAAARRRRRGPQPLHRRRHAHDAHQRDVLARPAPRLRARPRGPERPASTR